ncbi:Ras-specific guanine nucleotide-releasing factor RalGPS1, partial [Blyttiomyces sp. JEL0837]
MLAAAQAMTFGNLKEAYFMYLTNLSRLVVRLKTTIEVGDGGTVGSSSDMEEALFHMIPLCRVCVNRIEDILQMSVIGTKAKASMAKARDGQSSRRLSDVPSDVSSNFGGQDGTITPQQTSLRSPSKMSIEPMGVTPVLIDPALNPVALDEYNGHISPSITTPQGLSVVLNSPKGEHVFASGASGGSSVMSFKTVPTGTGELSPGIKSIDSKSRIEQEAEEMGIDISGDRSDGASDQSSSLLGREGTVPPLLPQTARASLLDTGLQSPPSPPPAPPPPPLPIEAIGFSHHKNTPPEIPESPLHALYTELSDKLGSEVGSSHSWGTSVSHMDADDNHMSPNRVQHPIPDHANAIRTKISRVLNQIQLANSVATIFSFRPIGLAFQLCLIEHKLLRKIHPSDLLTHAPPYHPNPSLQAASDFFNYLTRIIEISILEPVLPADRAKVIIRWIKVSNHLRKFNNFQTLKAVVSALNTPPIARLKKTWATVKRKPEVADLNEHKTLLSEQNNYQSYRELMKTSISRPMIPFLATDAAIQSSKKSLLRKRIGGGLSEQGIEDLPVLKDLEDEEIGMVISHWLLSRKWISEKEVDELSLVREPRVVAGVPAQGLIAANIAPTGSSFSGQPNRAPQQADESESSEVVLDFDDRFVSGVGGGGSFQANFDSFSPGDENTTSFFPIKPAGFGAKQSSSGSGVSVRVAPPPGLLSPTQSRKSRHTGASGSIMDAIKETAFSFSFVGAGKQP